MMTQQAYLVFDIGTGNARVAVVDINGNVLSIERADILYHNDNQYPDARHFIPEVLWEQIAGLAKVALSNVPDIQIIAVTSTSQRQGIVLIDEAGESYLGLPNIDNRGREWEEHYSDQTSIYPITGRTPSALFSAMKLVGLRERHPQQYQRLNRFTSISDWVTYALSGVLSYEPSQACETLLYNVEHSDWSTEMCHTFGIAPTVLPSLIPSGSVLGTLTSGTAAELNLPVDTPVIVGGGDTQLAIHSTGSGVEDIVIVSGTTTPIAKITDTFTTDKSAQAWINAYTTPHQFLIETNPGITGLNYQKLQSIFYPNEGYAMMEQEMNQLEESQCIAALGSYLSSAKNARVRGGFLFDAPLSDQLSRAHFVRSALHEIAFSIKVNFDQLAQVVLLDRPYIWACGGGLQSRTLIQSIADLLGKEIRIRTGFEHASIVGAAYICNEALDIQSTQTEQITTFQPQSSEALQKDYQQWHKAQLFFAQLQLAESATTTSSSESSI